MSKHNYHLHLKGYVGGYDFDASNVDAVLKENEVSQVDVLIDSLGGSLASALSIVASFKNHGNVHVHYVGMNASAATIASLGAKHVSIDSAAMYLVHKCSIEFFQWASANSDKLSDIIKEARQMKTDLEKMDANVAQMYSAKCKHPVDELLSLMKKGGWLTAQEALEWGFVDEITDYEEDESPIITDMIAADMSAYGIPVPGNAIRSSSSTFFAKLTELFTNFFKSKEMNTETKQQEPLAAQQAQVPEIAADMLKAKDEQIESLQAQIVSLNNEIEMLKKAPGDSTHHVIDDKNGGAQQVKSVADEYFETVNRAQALYDEVR